MAQVILIEDNKNMNDLLSINLNTYLGVDLIQQDSAQDTLGLLSILPNIDLIITKDRIGNEDTAKILEKYIADSKLETTLIVLGTVKTPGPHTLCIENPRDWEKVVHFSAKVLGLNEHEIHKRITPDYIPVPVKYFLNLEASCCDVFIRIRKSPTEFQFIKRIHSGDNYSKESIERYQDQGLEHFFIPKEDQKRFSIFLSNKLVEKMDAPTKDINEKILLMGESYDVAIKEITKLGFTSETIQLTDSIVTNMIKNFSHGDEMAQLLHRVINSKTGMLFQRCHMTSVVASECLNNLKITEKESFEKIAFASFFHDVLFIDKEELSIINNQEDLDKANLSEADKELVFTHAKETALLLQKHPEAPKGVDEIIRHHHGSYAGTGFSVAIDQLPELSQIFIIAHQFVLELFLYKVRGGKPSPIVDELYKKYPGPKATLIIKAIEKTLKKKRDNE